MLSCLQIENVAVIQKAEVHFQPGLNVLTGETGAGKSILIDSINAILGNRTSKDLVRTGASKAVIRASFAQIPDVVLDKLEAAGYERSAELLLSREITAEGKSSCRINGMPTTAAVLRELCGGLININGQRYMVKYRLISGETSAIGTLITTSSASRILQEEQHIRKGLVRRGLTSKYTFRDIIAVSERMCSKVDMAKKFSRVNSNVLLTGETGTGKELFAHSIHAASARAEQPFVAVNCATLPENLLESELFGYEAGAFSGASREGKTGLFEQAHHGTIFLDEIGEIPVALQAKLLRVLQEKEVRRVGSTNVIPIDVRVISATNVNIQQQIQQGKFRSDLLYRLNTLEIHIPPLRERPEDILPLIEHQMRIIAAEQGTTPPELTPEAQELLKQYRWPGNVRELRNICERIVVMSSSRTVDQSTLMDLHIFRELPPEPAGQPASPSESLPVMLPQVIRKKDLAKELGVSRTTLWRMSKRLEQQKEQQT